MLQACSRTMPVLQLKTLAIVTEGGAAAVTASVDAVKRRRRMIIVCD